MPSGLSRDHDIIRTLGRYGFSYHMKVSAFAAAYGRNLQTKLTEDSRMPRADRAEADHEGYGGRHVKTS